MAHGALKVAVSLTTNGCPLFSENDDVAKDKEQSRIKVLSNMAVPLS
jgi:hypothetical protein